MTNQPLEHPQQRQRAFRMPPFSGVTAGTSGGVLPPPGIARSVRLLFVPPVVAPRVLRGRPDDSLRVSPALPLTEAPAEPAAAAAIPVEPAVSAPSEPEPLLVERYEPAPLELTAAPQASDESDAIQVIGHDHAASLLAEQHEVPPAPDLELLHEEIEWQLASVTGPLTMGVESFWEAAEPPRANQAPVAELPVPPEPPTAPEPQEAQEPPEFPAKTAHAEVAAGSEVTPASGAAAEHAPAANVAANAPANAPVNIAAVGDDERGEELTAALAWPPEGSMPPGEAAAESRVSDDAALAAAVSELHESAAPWAHREGARDLDRAWAYPTFEQLKPQTAAVAQTLERLAERIRAGGMLLSREAAAGGDAGTLAAVLAALLREDRHG